MAIFIFEADKDAFLAIGERIVRVPEQTSYYIFAESKDAAKQLSEEYIAHKIGHGSKIESQAIFDPVSSWLRQADANKHLRIIEDTVADASRFIGTIEIESFAVTSPATDKSTLIIKLAEGHHKRRCLLKNVHFMEDGSVEWGDDMGVFDVAALAVAIQDLF